jgi:hypothetical protein
MHRGISFVRLAVVAIVLLACGSGRASAGWLSFRNDTRSTLVIQEIVVVNGQARRGPQRQLYPGEVAVESVSRPGVKHLLIIDPKQPSTPLLRTEVSYTTADQIYSIRLESPPVAGAQPRCKLVPVSDTSTTRGQQPRKP